MRNRRMFFVSTLTHAVFTTALLYAGRAGRPCGLPVPVLPVCQPCVACHPSTYSEWRCLQSTIGHPSCTIHSPLSFSTTQPRIPSCPPTGRFQHERYHSRTSRLQQLVRGLEARLHTTLVIAEVILENVSLHDGVLGPLRDGYRKSALMTATGGDGWVALGAPTALIGSEAG